MDNCKQTNIPKVDNTEDNCCFTATDECIFTTNSLPTIGTSAGDSLENVLTELDTYIDNIQVGVVSWGSLIGDINNQTDLQNELNIKANDDEVVKSINSILPDSNGNINITTMIWGNLTGDITDQTDLNTALNLKANDNEVVKSVNSIIPDINGNVQVPLGFGLSTSTNSEVRLGVEDQLGEHSVEIPQGESLSFLTSNSEFKSIIDGTSAVISMQNKIPNFAGDEMSRIEVGTYQPSGYTVNRSRVLLEKSTDYDNKVYGINIGEFSSLKMYAPSNFVNETYLELSADTLEYNGNKANYFGNLNVSLTTTSGGFEGDNIILDNSIFLKPKPGNWDYVGTSEDMSINYKGDSEIQFQTFTSGDAGWRALKINFSELSDDEVPKTLFVRNKSGTIALLDDIPSPQPTPTFQEITAAGSTTTDSITIGEPVNSSDAATKNYVDNEISNIPPVDLSNYATLTDLDNVTITESQITDLKDYIRGDVDDNNGSNKLTLGSLEVDGQTTLQNVLKLNSVATGTSENILILNQSTGDVEQRVFSLGDIDIANAAGTSQFPVGLGGQLRIQGSGDTSISFDGVTNTINISSTPGAGGGGAVTSFNGRDGAVVSQAGDYSTAMVNENTNLYFTEGRVRGTELTGLSINNTPIGNTNTIIQALGRLQGQINNKENSFSKNSAFNKNFGTTAGTVAQGNDSRINNGQTAYGWGNHASAGYALASRTISAGTGLTGGGNLGGNRTINIGGNVTPLTATKIPGSQNLNSYQNPGFYYQSANADAASGSNYPADQSGSLVVQKAAGVTQQYYKYGTGTPDMWIRGFYSGTWTSWGKVWNSANDGSGSGLDADTVDGVHASSFARTSTTISAGTGLTGGGSIGSNRTINVSFGTSSSTVARGNDSRINNGQTAYGWGNHASAGYVPSGRTISAGTHLSGGGNLTSNRAINFTPEANNWIVDNQGNQRMYFGNTSSTIGPMFRASAVNQEFQYRNSSNSIVFRINNSGVATATNFIATSDERLKKNKKKIDNALDKLDLISGYTWQWIEDETESAGAMAQEVEKVLPEAVEEDSEGIKGLNYNAIIGLLIEAIKEERSERLKLEELLRKENKR